MVGVVVLVVAEAFLVKPAITVFNIFESCATCAKIIIFRF